MDLRYGSTVLMTILSANAPLKAKLDTFTVGTTEYLAIFVASVLPENRQDLTNRKFTDYSGVSVYLRSSVARAIMDAENNWFVPVDIRISSKL